jgi:hypothetical protein
LRTTAAIIWSKEDRMTLAQGVIRRLGKEAVFCPDADLLKALRDAALSDLDPDKQKPVDGMSRATWLRPLLRQLTPVSFFSPNGQPPEQRPGDDPGHPIVNPPRKPQDAPGAAPEPPVVPEPDPPPKRRRKPAYVKILRQQSKEIAGMRADMQALIELLEEVFSGSRSGEEWEPEPVREPEKVLTTTTPLIVVAGLKGNQQDIVRRAVGEHVELEFIDANKRWPETIGDCDHLFAMRHSGGVWLRKAGHVFKGRLTKVNGTADIVALIRRMFLTQC